MKKLQIALAYYSLFLLSFGILLFVKPISAEETVIKVPTLAEGLDRKELSSKIKENEDSSKWLSWFKGENLAVRTSFFGGRIRHERAHFLSDFGDVNALETMSLSGNHIWGGEFGIGYKIGYGIELGISYMFMEVNDWRGAVLDIDPPSAPDVIFPARVNMDLDSRAAMFNVRAYLDELTGIDTGRFSPYIFGSVGRATHKISDHKERDDINPPFQTFNFYTSHNNKGEAAYRVGMGTLFKLTDHIKIDASASFMDWGKARTSRYFQGDEESNVRRHRSPPEISVRTIQGSFGIQFNF
jgi:opacity protein-like surface antigen